MKTVLIFILFIFALIFGCKENESNDEMLHSVNLNFNLGTLEFNLPNYFDTSKVTMHFSDIRCGDEVRHLFYNNVNDTLYPDTTGEWGPFPKIEDTTELVLFKISQCIHEECGLSEAFSEQSLDELTKSIHFRYSSTNIIKQELINIGNIENSMMLVMFSTGENKSDIKGVFAILLIESKIIKISYSQSNFDNNSVALETYKCIKQMRITE